MTNLTTETGFLTSDGQTACQPIRDKLREILGSQTDEIRLRSLGCVLMALVADEVSIAMQKVRQSK